MCYLPVGRSEKRKAVAKGRICKTEVTVFHYTDQAKSVNYFFRSLFFSKLFFNVDLYHTHTSRYNVTVIRDMKTRTGLRTNQIAVFVTVHF